MTDAPRPVETTVVIPMYGLAEMTLACIRSVQAGAPLHRLIVVDDASPGDAGAWLRAQAPEVEVLTLPENLGFGRAVNRGVALATSPVVVILNNDTVVEPGFLAAISAPLLDGPADLGSVVAVVLRDDRITIDAVGTTFDRRLRAYPRLAGQPVTEAADPWPPLAGAGGCVAAYRLNAWRQCGGFDERIPAYHEDTDLCLRIHRGGWRTTVAPDARLRHLGSRTYGRQPKRVMALSAFGRGYLLRRHRHLLPGSGISAIAQEAVMSAFACVRRRSPLPLTERLAGWRSATPLPRTDARPPMMTGALAGLYYRHRGISRPSP